MNKKFVVALVIQSALILILLVYAFVQQGIAREKSIEAQKYAEIAQQNANEAMSQSILAREEARRARELTTELMKCKK